MTGIGASGPWFLVGGLCGFDLQDSEVETRGGGVVIETLGFSFKAGLKARDKSLTPETTLQSCCNNFEDSFLDKLAADILWLQCNDFASVFGTKEAAFRVTRPLYPCCKLRAVTLGKGCRTLVRNQHTTGARAPTHLNVCIVQASTIANILVPNSSCCNVISSSSNIPQT